MGVQAQVENGREGFEADGGTEVVFAVFGAHDIDEGIGADHQIVGHQLACAEADRHGAACILAVVEAQVEEDQAVPILSDGHEPFEEGSGFRSGLGADFAPSAPIALDLRGCILCSGRAGTCNESCHARGGQQLATGDRAEAAMGETVRNDTLPRCA